MIYQFGSAFTGSMDIIGFVVSLAIAVGMIYMLVRPYKEAAKLTAKVNV